MVMMMMMMMMMMMIIMTMMSGICVNVRGTEVSRKSYGSLHASSSELAGEPGGEPAGAALCL
eukprot:1082981-Karenia_brevis.AAC.1